MDETSQADTANVIETQMRKGMLLYCVLLLCKDGRVYSSEIIKSLRTAELIVVEGTLYPLLSRLARENLLGYEWQESEQGPPRKYYWLTDEGHEVLTEVQKVYTRLSKSISTLEQDNKSAPAPEKIKPKPKKGTS